MKIHTFTQEQQLPISLTEAWEFFSRPANLEKITPPEMGFETTYRSHELLTPGQIIVHRIKIAPAIRLTWVSEIKWIDAPYTFIDEQRSGPYAFWQHRHSFEQTATGVLCKDLVHYALPLYPFGELGHALFVRPQLEKIFAFRKHTLADYFKGASSAPPAS